MEKSNIDQLEKVNMGEFDNLKSMPFTDFNEEKLLILWLHLTKIRNKNYYMNNILELKELYRENNFAMDKEYLLQYINNVYKCGINILFYCDTEFLKLRSEFGPIVIYYIGDKKLLMSNTIGFVGSRKASNYGLTCTGKIIENLKGQNIVTVSGGAYGIDSRCHLESLKNNIKTISILGGGLLHLYPHENIFLFKSIITNGGLILSEYPIYLRPKKYFFPERNRIIAKLSDVLVIPEASKNSGSMHTVEQMTLLNKEVLVVPHDVSRSTGEGNNELIKMGFTSLNNLNEITNYINAK